MEVKDEKNEEIVAEALGVGENREVLDTLAIRTLPLHKFGKNRGVRSIVKAWKTAAVVHDATHLIYSRYAANKKNVSLATGCVPKRVMEFVEENRNHIATLARIDVVGKTALKTINETLRPKERVRFTKVRTIKKQRESLKKYQLLTKL